nr:MAG TPA: hypothetical protein [Caudoviricetes sp.]
MFRLSAVILCRFSRFESYIAEYTSPDCSSTQN